MKNILPTLLLSIISSTFLLHAAEDHSLLEANAVKATLTQQNRQRNILVIGVCPGEPKFHERFDHLINDRNTYVVFADQAKETEPFPGHFLQGDFDNPQVIQKVGEIFQNTFDVIITDGPGTTKFLPNTAQRLNKLCLALKLEGSLFFHDYIETRFINNPLPSSLSFNANDLANFEEILSAKLQNAFGRLTVFDFLLSSVSSIAIDQAELEKLTDAVMILVNQYDSTPQCYIKTANEIMKLGLKNAPLLGGGPRVGFPQKEKADISAKVKVGLQIKGFLNEHFVSLVESVKNVQKAFLDKSYRQVEVVSQDTDQESLAILTPNDKGNPGYIIYKLRGNI